VAPAANRKVLEMSKIRTTLRVRTIALLVAMGFVLVPAHSAAAGPVEVARSAANAKPTIVLVHGAWADGSSFGLVTTALQVAGYQVLAPPNPLRGLEPDTDYLEAFLRDRTTGPVVLVGHSYGGAIITNAALSDPDVKALVYVNAFAPAEGETVLQLTAAQPGSRLAVEDPTTVFDFVEYPGSVNHDVDLFIRQDQFRSIMAQNTPSAITKGLAASQRPVAFSAFGSPSGANPAWASLPSWFFIGTQDQVLPPAQQRIMADRANGTVTEAKASHISMLDKPLQVTKVIIDAASNAG